MMTDWIETFRGTVVAWEVDLTEHFTIAYYFDRFGEAVLTLAEAVGIADLVRAPDYAPRFTVRFVRELRAGDSFHVESAPIGLDGDTLRLGHRVRQSATGEVVTWAEQRIALPAALPAPRRDALEQCISEWGGPPIEARPEPGAGPGWMLSGMGRVKPADLDEVGRFSLTAFVHRYSAANFQSFGRLGMTVEHLRQARRGLSTFELILRVDRWPVPGEILRIETGIAHIGRSSIRFVHRMIDAAGAELGRMSQYGVMLDLDARRPTAIPDEYRTRLEAALLT